MTVGCMGCAGPAEPTFHINIIESQPDTVACGINGGKAGMVADIDEDGNLISDWMPVCITRAQ